MASDQPTRKPQLRNFAYAYVLPPVDRFLPTQGFDAPPARGHAERQPVLPPPPAPPPPGILSVTPIPLYFTIDVAVNATGTEAWDVSNIGESPLSGYMVLSTGSFTNVGNGSYTLNPGDHQSVYVGYTPQPPVSDILAGTVTWFDSGTGYFIVTDGIGGTLSPVFATGTLQLCPVVGTHPTINVPYDFRNGVRVNNRREIWLSGTDKYSVVSMISNTTIHTTDEFPVLFNTQHIYDSVNDQVVTTDQRGHLFFIDPDTYVQTGPLVLPSTFTPGSPPFFGMCYDSVNAFAVTVLPGLSGNAGNVSIVNCTVGTIVGTHSFGTASKMCLYNPDVQKVMVGRYPDIGPHPWYFFDTVTFAKTVSTLTIGATEFFSYIPELHAILVQTIDINSNPTGVYVIDAVTDTIIAQIHTNTVGNPPLIIDSVYSAYNSCNGMLYIGGGFQGLFRVDTSTWIATNISQDAVDAIWFDPYSNLIYGTHRATNTIKTYS